MSRPGAVCPLDCNGGKLLRRDDVADLGGARAYLYNGRLFVDSFHKAGYYSVTVGSYMDESFDPTRSGIFAVGGILGRGVAIFELERRWEHERLQHESCLRISRPLRTAPPWGVLKRHSRITSARRPRWPARGVRRRVGCGRTMRRCEVALTSLTDWLIQLG